MRGLWTGGGARKEREIGRREAPGPLGRIGGLGGLGKLAKSLLQNATHANMALLHNDTAIMTVAKSYICQNDSVAK